MNRRDQIHDNLASFAVYIYWINKHPQDKIFLMGELNLLQDDIDDVEEHLTSCRICCTVLKVMLMEMAEVAAVTVGKLKSLMVRQG